MKTENSRWLIAGFLLAASVFLFTGQNQVSDRTEIGRYQITAANITTPEGQASHALYEVDTATGAVKTVNIWRPYVIPQLNTPFAAMKNQPDQPATTIPIRNDFPSNQPIFTPTDPNRR
jgi:hypothetical protein